MPPHGAGEGERAKTIEGRGDWIWGAGDDVSKHVMIDTCKGLGGTRGRRGPSSIAEFLPEC